MAHVIRLRGPWEYEPLARRFTRRFHRPTGLDPHTRVWLVIEDVGGESQVSLNDRLLVPDRASATASSVPSPARFDLTALLAPQNRLSIVVSSQTFDDHQAEDLLGSVRLEIM